MPKIGKQKKVFHAPRPALKRPALPTNMSPIRSVSQQIYFYVVVFAFRCKSHPTVPPSDPMFERWGFRGSPFRLRLQGQDPLAFAALLLMGRPIPLLTLRATVACNLTAATDIELSQLRKDKKNAKKWV